MNISSSATMENDLCKIVLNHSVNFANIAKMSEEPLDLSLPKNQCYLKKESSDVPIKGRKVMTKLWQTGEVMRRDESLRRFMSQCENGEIEWNADPVLAVIPESLWSIVKSNDLNQTKDPLVKDLIAEDCSKAPGLKKRNRFTITQLFLLEKVFERRMFVTPKQIQQLGCLLDVEEYRVKIWFQSRRQKWKKENNWNKKDHIRKAAFAPQSALLSQELETSLSTRSTL